MIGRSVRSCGQENRGGQDGSWSKKVINDPDRLIDEAIEGMVLAAGGRLVSLPGASTMMRPEIADGKVALLIGGGERA